MGNYFYWRDAANDASPPANKNFIFFRYKVYFFVNIMVVINTNKKEIIKFGDTILIRSFYYIPEVY